MKVFGVFLALAALVWPAVACWASTLYVFGEVGKAPVLAMLDREGDAVSGWYFYLAIGKEIQLNGKVDASGSFQLAESLDSRQTGRFEGVVIGGRWTGVWRKAAGAAAFPFTFNETRDALAGQSGQYRCATKRRDKAYGWTYEHSLSLVLRHGAVQAFDASLTAASAQGETQSCYYGLDNFTQRPFEAGVLLTSKSEGETDTADSQHCTIRVVDAGDYLLVKFGDPAQKNDDCRATASRAFCSPRALMADMIVNRKTQACMTVE